jgi:hypothetical protein
MKNELATSIIGIVRNLLLKRIVKKNIIDNINDIIIHILLKISTGINQNSIFIVEEFLRNMFDVAFLLLKFYKWFFSSSFI